MIVYKKIPTEIAVAEKISCDKCLKEYSYKNTLDTLEIQEFIHIRDIGGYTSIFGDGTKIEYDICQHCFFSFVN